MQFFCLVFIFFWEHVQSSLILTFNLSSGNIAFNEYTNWRVQQLIFHRISLYTHSLNWSLAIYWHNFPRQAFAHPRRTYWQVLKVRLKSRHEKGINFELARYFDTKKTNNRKWIFAERRIKKPIGFCRCFTDLEQSLESASARNVVKSWTGILIPLDFYLKFSNIRQKTIGEC